MKATALLLELLHNGVQLWVEGDELCIRAAKGVLTPALREELSRRKPEVVALLGQQARHALPSFAQQRLWFLDQLEPGTPTYNIPRALRLTGRLNATALERSLDEIVRRHEALRTTFAVVDGSPVQVIAPASALTLPLIDLSELPQAEREAEVRRMAREEARSPFDLARGPLLRTALLRLGEQDHALLINMHHIVSDAWSMGVFHRELATLYDAFSAGRPSPLAELPIQYADYSVWQQKWLQGEVLDEYLAYWERQLADISALQLPTDRPRPAVQTHRGSGQGITLPESLTQALKELSRREGVTLFMTLLATLQALLSRYTGQDDIAIGTPIANRNRAETEGLIGFFINTLVMRGDLSGDPTFRELLGRVREVALGAYAYQDLPFEKVLEKLNPERDLSRTPLCQVFLNFANTQKENDSTTIELSGLKAERISLSGNTLKFDLTFSFRERRGGLGLGLSYDTDLFEAATIARMLGHFRSLLEEVVADPDRRLSELSLLTEAERDQILIKWNNTRAEYPRDACVHELFAAQAEQTPDNVAVVFEDQQLTYRELNRRANQLARHLQSLGVGPEVAVGICVERSVEMVIGLLGILKAGGAYVPLDPAYPKERLSFMLEDAQAPVLLTQRRLLEKLSEHRAHVVCLDADWEGIAGESDDNLAGGAAPGNLAYVVYTSGSTGRPKGVQIEHRSLVNAYFAWEKAYQLRTSVRSHLQVASFAFDVFSGDLVRALCSGGKLVLCSRELLLTPRALYGLMSQERIDCAELVPAVLRNLVQHLEQQHQHLGFMKLLICGSDSSFVEELAEFGRHCGSQTRLINSYGMAEATVDSTYFEHTALDLPNGRLVPIGRPFANTQVYVLDGHLRPVPVGVPGELYVGGDGLARGYLSRPELTAERFIPDPFSGESGARLYRTGDLARYLPDGNIEFVGRLDHQVKVRGFRVEPGEVEVALTEHPAVRESVVVAREEEPGDKRLVAYYVALNGERTPQTNELRGYLKERLPDYMVPSAFVELKELPLTPNGKVDRRALPTPDPFSFRGEHAYAAPRTPVEEVLVGIWAEVLGIEQVGIHDDFFELGGHSLLATRVISRLRDAFRVELPLRSLFEAPTVAGLAVAINQRSPGEVEQEKTETTHSLAPPARVSRRAASSNIPLSFAQQRLWFLDQLEPNSPLYNMPQAIRLSGVLDVAALQKALDAIVARHEALRTTFAWVDGTPVQVIAPASGLMLPLIDLSGLPQAEREAEAQRRAREEARRPFDLAQGPLFRTKLLQLGEEEHVLLVSMHHIVSDGWSIGVFWRELATLYNAFSVGKPSPLAKLPIQYTDYAVWQREWLQGEELETQLSYWKRQLADVPALELPTDHPRPAVQTHRGARQSLTLPKSLTEALSSLSRREGVTLFMVLLAAFQVLLSRYSGQKDIAVGSPIAGRNRAEIEGLIGFFINTLVLRTDLSGDPTFRELLGRVREVALGAYAHQELPFEKLVEELKPQRDLSRTPLFQVFLNMDRAGGGTTTFELSGLRAKPTPSSSEGRAKFDLTLYVSERRGEGLRLRLVYNADLFEQDTMSRLLGHFQTLLEGIVADPGRRLSELSLLTEEERRRLPGRSTDVTKDVRPAKPFTQWTKEEIEQSIPQRFEQQVRKYPHNVAVKTRHHEWTYAELNAKANQVAHALLRRCGSGPDGQERIALLFEHGAPMIAGLLGVLKAGKTYVPLDASYPRERLAHMLQDAQVGAVLTEEANLALATALTEDELELIDIGELGSPDLPARVADVEDVLTEDTDLAVSPEDVAYILYTSGSTGQPKGVVQNHRNVLHFIRAYTNNLQIGAEDRLTLLSSYTFDAAVMDVFGALLNGATLYPIDLKEEGLSALVERLVEQEITVYHSTPTVYRHFVDSLHRGGGAQEELPSLRLVVLGGEAVNREDVELYKAHFSEDCLLVNLLGSTESSVSLQLFVDRGTPLARHAVAVGYPAEGTEVLLLDEAGKEAEVFGEIAIKSPYIALGYWRRPELSHKAFLPDPAGGDRQIYRTGDMGRLLPDGQIEWRGRTDYQVKLRGHRIELGEIETVLSGHPSVREGAVVVREDEGSGERRLVAYVVPRSQQALTERELRGYLKEKLPEYMVPSAFVMLEVLPLTPTGKVDRRALPAPYSASFRAENAYVSPRTPVEETLAGIWAEVLGLKRVGVHDDFFELGGHSLLATQLVSRLREALQVELPLRHLFMAPTVALLAQRVIMAEQSTSSLSIAKTYLDNLDEGRL